MKLFITADMEGITGLTDYSFVRQGELNYLRGREIMTDDVNHVIESAYAAGAQEIVVNDSHGKMHNLLIERIHPDVRLITGNVKPLSMVQGLDSSYDAALFVGYHSSAAKKGIMSHTMTNFTHQVYIDDAPVGEIGLNAYVAGYYGVPVILVTGDDQAAQEAEELIPGITTAVVKEQITRSTAICLTPQKSGELLRRQTSEALQNRSRVKPLVPADKPLLRVHFNSNGHAEWANLIPGTEIEGNTPVVRYQAKDMLDAYKTFMAMVNLAKHTTYS
ncbi:M55 family metallopeptidase [Paenibacillus hodogayensis]|uniref:M55 family metallopeptidase n=1 Tax=Paenibacillus hodogayensis TaxID=279208 RepID=A0ABV5VVG5_9BACL